ncbi:TetR/AcrR family transcriptional regulator [Tardiphaga sp.]|uniref:TetR/AcrR family transcriptional regulator n=1 Tax=Tardiphaga sp. TaxID=1926292 RepID=UPI00260B2A96|nr:TetR/AcrR family transcriptional regulator [Tardiphaga sp.]MDB5619934.1 transcriptional regulator [Tardiphaga sp.]
MSAKMALMEAGRSVFETSGFDRSTVSAICARAKASNGSFFHFFRTKEGLAATLFLECLTSYHDAMLAAVEGNPPAVEGTTNLVEAHLNWVVTEQRRSKFLFEQSRSEWLASFRSEQLEENTRFGSAIDAWRIPLVAKGAFLPLSRPLFLSLVIGPAQMFCRAWLSGREKVDPRSFKDELCNAAIRGVVAQNVGKARRRAE